MSTIVANNCSAVTDNWIIINTQYIKTNIIPNISLQDTFTNDILFSSQIWKMIIFWFLFFKICHSFVHYSYYPSLMRWILNSLSVSAKNEFNSAKIHCLAEKSPKLTSNSIPIPSISKLDSAQFASDIVSLLHACIVVFCCSYSWYSNGRQIDPHLIHSFLTYFSDFDFKILDCSLAYLAVDIYILLAYPAHNVIDGPMMMHHLIFLSILVFAHAIHLNLVCFQWMIITGEFRYFFSAYNANMHNDVCFFCVFCENFMHVLCICKHSTIWLHLFIMIRDVFHRIKYCEKLIIQQFSVKKNGNFYHCKIVSVFEDDIKSTKSALVIVNENKRILYYLSIIQGCFKLAFFVAFLYGRVYIWTKSFATIAWHGLIDARAVHLPIMYYCFYVGTTALTIVVSYFWSYKIVSKMIKFLIKFVK